MLDTRSRPYRFREYPALPDENPALGDIAEPRREPLAGMLGRLPCLPTMAYVCAVSHLCPEGMYNVLMELAIAILVAVLIAAFLGDRKRRKRDRGA
jgi:hypothetical protein